MQQVVPHHPRLLVGDVLELVAVGDVAERPDPRGGGALVLVDDDQAGAVDLHAGAVQVETVGVGASGRWRRAGCPRRGPRSRRRCAGAAGCPRRTPRPSRWWCRAGRPSARGASSVNRRETSASSARSSASERLTRVTSLPKEPKMCANSAATKPPPMIAIRPGRSSMRMIVSLVWCSTVVEPGDLGDDGPAAGGEHHLVGGDRRAGPGVDRPVAGEPGVALEERDVLQTLRAVAAAGDGDRVDPAEDAVADLRPADPSSRRSTPRSRACATSAARSAG